MNIYRSFEQWKNGGFLEHGAPRTEEYTAEELHLVEMGWNYGYDAGRAVEQALDKKAENARELGLSYDDEPKIGCVNHDCDKCKAVQEPVATLFGSLPVYDTTPPAAQPDYAWPTIADYEKEVGFEVNIAFRSAWAMARTTNDLFKQMGETK
jgi:hypothetical protein